MIVIKMLINILCFVGNNCFPWLKIPISTLHTRLHIHRGLYWWSIKRKNIYRMRSRKETAYVLDKYWSCVNGIYPCCQLCKGQWLPFLGQHQLLCSRDFNEQEPLIFHSFYLIMSNLGERLQVDGISMVQAKTWAIHSPSRVLVREK